MFRTQNSATVAATGTVLATMGTANAVPSSLHAEYHPKSFGAAQTNVAIPLAKLQVASLRDVVTVASATPDRSVRDRPGEGPSVEGGL